MSQENVQNIPIQVTDALLFDDALTSMKDRFTAHMKDVEQEMNKVSKILEGQTAGSNASSATSKGPLNLEILSNSPLVEGEGENRKLKLKFDVSQFDASEITVTMQDNKLTVSATHAGTTDKSTTLRQYRKEFHFPQGIDPKTIVSTLTKEGVLVVEAALPTSAQKQLAK